MKAGSLFRISLASLTVAFAGTLFASGASAQVAHGLKPDRELQSMSAQQLADLFARSKPAERLIDKPVNQIPATLRTMNVNSGPAPVMVAGNPGSGGSGNGGGNDRGGGLGVGTQTGSAPAAPQTNDVAPQNYGQGNLNTIFHYNDYFEQSYNVYPYRAAGYFLFRASDGNWYHCTASLINRSILVTAGHCIHDGGNQAAGWIQAGIFYPARAGNSAPYGAVYASHLVTTNGWYNTGSITQGYDVGIVVLHKANAYPGQQIGNVVGWLGFCYRWCLQEYWFMTQLGYPGNYYNGIWMTTSQHVEMSDSKDYQYGTGMRGGSSGGPHISNIGSIVDNSTSLGQFTPRNIVMAVTSWGYVSHVWKVQGASSLSGPGNSNNFRGMYNWACNISRALHGAGSCTDLP